MPDEPAIHHMGAGRLARAIAQGALSAETVVRHYLQRINDFNGALNALVLVDEQGAIDQARAADRVLETGGSRGPLHGVPITIKDCFATAGLKTTFGHRDWVDHVPEADATTVARLRSAGAIILGKTNLPPFASDFQTANKVFGRTCNPWDLSRTAGGSTGGGAATVAAGLSPLELGSDIGGSIRIPAHFCGTFGLKATENRIPITGYLTQPPLGVKTERYLESPGVIARNVEDLSLALEILAGPDDWDVDVPPVPVASAQDVPHLAPRDVRLAWCANFGDVGAGNEVATALEQTVDRFTAAGGRVKRIDLEGLDCNTAWEAWALLLAAFTRGGRRAEPEEIERLGASPEAFLREAARGADADLRTLFQALDVRDRTIRALDKVLADYDALLCPIAPMPAFTHRHWSDGLELDGETGSYFRLGTTMTGIFNLTGSPAVAIPSTLTAGGLPVGVQLVGRRWSEQRLLGVARTLADLLPPLAPPPGYA